MAFHVRNRRLTIAADARLRFGLVYVAWSVMATLKASRFARYFATRLLWLETGPKSIDWTGSSSQLVINTRWTRGSSR
jgi:hypothetical protein